MKKSEESTQQSGDWVLIGGMGGGGGFHTSLFPLLLQVSNSKGDKPDIVVMD